MSNLSIRLKFALVLVLIAGLFATAIWGAWKASFRVEADVGVLYSGPLRVVDVGRATERDFMDLRRHYLAASTMPQLRWSKRYGELREKVASDLDALAFQVKDEAIAKRLTGARALFSDWEGLLARGDFISYRVQIDKLADEFQADLDTIIDLAETSAKESVDNVGERIRDSRAIILIGGAGAAIVGMLIMLVLAGHIVRPLEQAAMIAEGISNGRFTDDIPLVRSDEPGQLLIVLSSMKRKIQAQQWELEQRNAELEHLAATDKLTGLANRRKLEDTAADHMASIRRYGGGLAAILLDIDHFKAVNDTHGHAVGDIVITQIASILTQAVRETDLVGRWGGEEFLILLPNTSLDGAAVLAEKIRWTISDYDFPVVGHKTSSFGVGELRDEEAIANFFDRIDQALYRAKQEGRNLVKLDKGNVNIVQLPQARSIGSFEA